MNEFFVTCGKKRTYIPRQSKEKKKRKKKKRKKKNERKKEKEHRTSMQPTAEFKHMRGFQQELAIVSRGAGSLFAGPQESGHRAQGTPLRSPPGGTDSERARPILPPPSATPAAGAAQRGPSALPPPPAGSGKEPRAHARRRAGL